MSQALLTRYFLVAATIVASDSVDWLVTPVATPVTISNDNCRLEMGNGLISRVWTVPGQGCPHANFGTIDLLDINAVPPRSALAAPDVEAWVYIADYWIGVGGPHNLTCGDLAATATPKQDMYSTCAYFNRSQPSHLQPATNASTFQYSTHKSGPIIAPFDYTPARHAAPDLFWPPKGLHLEVNFTAPLGCGGCDLQNVVVTVHYEMLAGAPVMNKWITISGPASDSKLAAQVIGDVIVETLRVNPDFAGQSYPVAGSWMMGSSAGVQPPLLYIYHDAAHGVECKWGTRMEMTYSKNPFLECRYSGSSTAATCHPDAHPAEVCPGSGEKCPECGQLVCNCPADTISPGVHATLGETSKSYFRKSFSNELFYESFKVRLLMLDTTEQERRGLALRQANKLLTPWLTENPLFWHLTNTSVAGVKQAVDDAASVGVEMIVQSFGTTFQMENGTGTYLAELQEQLKYAKTKDVEIGGYDLIVEDRSNLGPEFQGILPSGDSNGNACMASQWVDHLVPLISHKVTLGMSMIETDGPYGGQTCFATNHTHHKGGKDSTYWQTRLQSEFYEAMRSQGVFVNAPDNYFAHGSNKMMFYGDPTNFGKPRQMDLLLSRQMLYDATYEWLPTQGWSLVPLENYGGGGVEAAFLPLEANSKDYDLAWAMYMGYGVAGVCWRGPSIFEGPTSKRIVTHWIKWYKKYRIILTSGMLIHVRRPDGQGIDAVLHANPRGGQDDERGLLFLFNPTLSDVATKLSVPLYYTGLGQVALVAEKDDRGNAHTQQLQRDFRITLEVKVPAQGYQWFVIYGPTSESIVTDYIL